MHGNEAGAAACLACKARTSFTWVRELGGKGWVGITGFVLSLTTWLSSHLCAVLHYFLGICKSSLATFATAAR